MTLEVVRISKEMLREKLGTPGLVVIDVRNQANWESSGAKIPGALREIPAEEEKWMERYPKYDTYVFYCAEANEHTSAVSARKFMEAGFSEVYTLQGGWREWENARYPKEDIR